MYNPLICKIKKKCSPFCIIKYSLKNILFVKINYYLQPALLTFKFLLRRALFLRTLSPCQRKTKQIRHLRLQINIHIVLLTAMTFSKSFAHPFACLSIILYCLETTYLRLLRQRLQMFQLHRANEVLLEDFRDLIYRPNKQIQEKSVKLRISKHTEILVESA